MTLRAVNADISLRFRDAAASAKVTFSSAVSAVSAVLLVIFPGACVCAGVSEAVGVRALEMGAGAGSVEGDNAARARAGTALALASAAVLVSAGLVSDDSCAPLPSVDGPPSSRPPQVDHAAVVMQGVCTMLSFGGGVVVGSVRAGGSTLSCVVWGGARAFADAGASGSPSRFN